MAMKYFCAAVLIAVLVIVQKVDCLNCFSCKSSTSFADCKSKATEKSCPSTSPNCVGGLLTCTLGDDKETVYYLGCGEEGDDCGIVRDEQPSCPTSSMSWSYSSSNECCDGNLCNSPGGTDSMASAVVPGLSLCLALVFLVSALVCY